jgi:hypothetical protein
MANSNFVVHNGLTVGPLSVDAATGNMIATHILPKDTLAYNLGSPDKQWHSAYIGPGSLYVNGQKVLQDESGTIVLSADLDQNLSVQTKGAGDIIFDPTGTGVISLRGPVQMQVGSNFVSSDGNAISFINPIAVNAIAGATNNTDLTLSAQGTGQVKVDDTLTVTGDLIVQGTTSNFSVTNFTVQDNIIDLAGETSGNPTANAGIRIVRGDEPAVQLRWNETADKWQFTNDGTTYQDIQSANSSGDVAITGTLAVTGASTLHAVNATNVTASGTVAAGLFTGPLTGAVTGNTAGTHTGAVVGNVTGDVTGAVTGNTAGTHTGAVVGNVTGNVTGNTAGTHTGAVVGNVTGNVTGTAATVTGATQSAITAVGTLTALAVTGAVTAGSFTAGNVSVGATADAITSTGTLTLDPNPVGTGGLVVIQGNLQVTGTTTTINSATLDVTDLNITVAKGAANPAAANGAGLTVDGASASMLYTSTTDTFNFNKGVVANLTGNVTGNASGSALTVTQAAQPAITSVGTLTALGVTGTVTAGAFSGPLTGAVTGNASTATALQTARAINGVSFDGSAAITVTAAAGTLSGATLASGVTASSLTSVGTLTALGVTGTVTAGAFSGPVTGNTAGTHTGAVVGNASTATALQTARAINGVNFDGSAAITVTAAAGTLSGATLASGVTASSLTSVGTLTGLTVSGTIAASANNTINIGAAGTTFATVYATTFSGVSTTAKYADLAENYVGDAAIEPGTVVCFGGENEVTTCDADACSSVAGVVSSNPAYLMNSELAAEFVVAVAFTGRVPCKVTGTVKKGDLMVAAGNGRARAEANPKVGTVIGKALQASEGDAVIEVVVGR